jgi:hypothetical protein
MTHAEIINRDLLAFIRQHQAASRHEPRPLQTAQ